MPQSVVRLETSKFENNIGKNKLEYVKKSQKNWLKKCRKNLRTAKCENCVYEKQK